MKIECTWHAEGVSSKRNNLFKFMEKATILRKKIEMNNVLRLDFIFNIYDKKIRCLISLARFHNDYYAVSI